ncbi:patatin-like phospholipase family protein [Methylomonas albis]|uniref:Patatin-like phospholipase family protein n=1 Tax=Methylomonas albis TaxID=1854563 RepID=A0ABR9D0I3_9GAMM|nr:patatin-like phospholipase family protein [Methylomonas albis]MBD9355447.1 patatin-like phospholipase family protein [Methylomonas albis]
MKKSIALLVFIFISPICTADEISGDNLPGFYLVNTPNARLNNQQKYFSHEYQKINLRKNENDSEIRPKHLTGLALSGGGIRSSAYQLGILSGLYESKKNLLDIDYISSVSGGSWANGGYWAWASSDEEFFNCLFTAAINPKADCDAAVMLNSEQPFAILPAEGAKLKARKRQWKEYIESVYLPNCNVDAEDIKSTGIDSACARNYRTKPYVIINATHSVPTTEQGASEMNMPFQFTLDNIGTISDCHPDMKCKKGFFVNNISKDFAWVNNALFRKDKPENSLSAAMAASSGVVGAPVLLSYEYELFYQPRISLLGNWRGSNIKEIRKEIVLSDGGKSDNLGLVPLIERGVDLIVISYMGKDNDLNKNPWEDLDIAVKQVKNLLGCDVEKPGLDVDLSKNLIHESKYTCKNHNGKILHVKASYGNAKRFVEYLSSIGQSDLVNYLTVKDVENNKNENDRFPQTETMKQKYDDELIRSYYLMGRWVAKEYLSDIIKKTQENGTN